MAERRMFAKTIVLSDAFLDMPLGARCLYMTMGMLADDDGFINAPKSIMRQCGATEDDLRVLISKKFVIPFESGVIVIKHWRINNYLQKDRIQPTKYQDELALLKLEENGAYTESCIHEPVYIDKDSIDKDRIEKNSIEEREGAMPRSRSFTPPTLEEVEAYCQERNNGIDAQTFIDYYSARGWMMNSKNKMKDWKAAVRTWEQRHKDEQQQKQSNRKYTTAADYVPPKPSSSLNALREAIDRI